MSRNKSPDTITRRGFIRVTGLATVAAAFPKLSMSMLASRPLKIGMMLPPSSIYPEMGDNFIAGMKTYYAQADPQMTQTRATLTTENIGLGFGTAAAASRKLIESDGVDVVVGVIGSNTAAMLRPLYEQHRTLLVVANPGENVVRPNEISPYILHHSLNLWQSNWALGNWAATHLGNRAVLVTSFYDSGYDAPYTFRLGFEQAGGTILLAQVTHQSGDSGELTALMDAIKSAQPDFVYASYSGREAVQFLQAYAGSGLAQQVPLVGSSYLVDQAILAQSGSAALGVKTVLPWTDSLSTAENEEFMVAYSKLTGCPADTFAVLGYDTAQLITAAAGSSSLDRVQGVGPRGSWGVSTSTMHLTGSSLYLREVQRHGRTLKNVAVAVLAPVSEEEVRSHIAAASPKTGWSHPYLCV